MDVKLSRERETEREEELALLTQPCRKAEALQEQGERDEILAVNQRISAVAMRTAGPCFRETRSVQTHQSRLRIRLMNLYYFLNEKFKINDDGPCTQMQKAPGQHEHVQSG